MNKQWNQAIRKTWGVEGSLTHALAKLQATVRGSVRTKPPPNSGSLVFVAVKSDMRGKTRQYNEGETYLSPPEFYKASVEQNGVFGICAWFQSLEKLKLLCDFGSLRHKY